MTSIGRFFSLFAFALGMTLASGNVLAEQISVAVASNFTKPMQEIAEKFQQDSGHKVSLSFGSSGKFYAQIVNGAPFQIFFSADQDKAIKLDEAGFTTPNSRFTYAIGSLALWSPNPDLIDEDLTALKQQRFNKLALANPKLAPYGMAAVETLETLGLREATQAQWVQGENIAQTYQFIQTGNAELGFVALSQVTEQGEIKQGSAWVVPAEMHQPIRQDAVILKNGETSAAAHQFMLFVRSNKAAAIIKSYGYETELRSDG